MATKKEAAAVQAAKAKNDSAVAYKALIAIVVVGACLMGLHYLHSLYSTIGGMELLDPAAKWIAIGGFAAFAVLLLADLFIRNRISRMVLPWFVALSFLVGITGLSMHTSWTQGFPMLYFLCCAVGAQYVIMLLYRWEFFLFSLATVSAGGLFLSFHCGFQGSPWGIGFLAVAVILLVGITLVTRYASSNHGMLVLGKKRITIFPAKSNPLLLYLVVALWLVCIVASLLLGTVFAYYCMFAAVAVELIGGVYYTFQLN